MKRLLAASSLKVLFVLGPAVLCTTGCTKYYKVIDPTTNKVYYTTELDQNHGTVTLKDARTGNKVTVQNSEIDEIKKEEFESGKSAPPVPETPKANPAAGIEQPMTPAPAPSSAAPAPSSAAPAPSGAAAPQDAAAPAK